MGPKISVVMPVYNGGKFLVQSIKSILSQTCHNFEFIIIDDGSTDSSADIIKSFADQRIKYFKNEVNKGLIFSLNKGLDLSGGEYIARMDQDDISLRDRFTKQLKILERNPDVGICGAFMKTFGKNKRSRVARFQTTPEKIKAYVLFNTAIPHPTMMMRKSLLLKHGLRYEDYKNVEDLAFCFKASHCFPLLNVPEVLLNYRISNTSMMASNSLESRIPVFKSIYRMALTKLGITPTESELDLHFRISNICFPKDDSYIDLIEQWLQHLIEVNDNSLVYDRLAFREIVAYWWFQCCSLGVTSKNLKTWHRYFTSSLSEIASVSFKSKARFMAKCILNK